MREWVILLSQKDLEHWFFFVVFLNFLLEGGGRHFFRWLYASGFPFTQAIHQIDDGHSEKSIVKGHRSCYCCLLFAVSISFFLIFTSMISRFLIHGLFLSY